MTSEREGREGGGIREGSPSPFASGKSEDGRAIVSTPVGVAYDEVTFVVDWASPDEELLESISLG